MIEFLGLLLLILIPLYAAVLLIFLSVRRRRAARSWRAWRRLQAGTGYAWRIFFGGPRGLRLTHNPAPEVTLPEEPPTLARG